MSVLERWITLKNHVASICTRHHRSPNSVTIVGVTKYVGIDATRELINAGCHHLGESRPQQLWDKVEQLQSEAIEWHLIGHLQRNKVARTIPLISTLHSLDSLRLAEAISTVAIQTAKVVACFLEVNISGEDSKTGIQQKDIEPLIIQIQKLPGVSLVGLMGMASDTPDKEIIANQFNQLRSIRDELHSQYANENHPLSQLSMGMSQDYEVAIACGATHIRVGSTLFSSMDS